MATKPKNHGGGATKVVVVMVPFPAQGHLNQLLQLSRLVSSYNISVHFVGTATLNRQARSRVHGWNPMSAANIHFHEFPAAANAAAVSPSPADSRFPDLLSSYGATSLLRDPVGKLLRGLAGKSSRVVVIHDSLMGSVVQDAAAIPNAESYIFHSVSAFAIFLFIWEKMGKPFAVDADILRDLPSLEGCFSPEFERFLKAQYDFLKFNSGRIYNTCRALEGPFLELLSREEIIGDEKKTQWALGPFNPVHVSKSTHPPRHKSLAWLDNQPQNSVIFVSFGTTTSFSDEQIREIATGLEKSGQRFVWVLRDADKADIFSKEHRKIIELPKEFEERIKKRGLVVRDWAPQLEVLAHSSTGGFLSHCGWNSCMESISMGVPIAAWPMHSDQPRNTVLVTKVLRIGIVVKDWARRDQIVTSFAVEQAVKRLMATEEGRRMREKAAGYGCAMRKAVGDGGVSRMELDAFVDHITRS